MMVTTCMGAALLAGGVAQIPGFAPVLPQREFDGNAELAVALRVAGQPPCKAQP
jgi:hypothetical protein